jgi:hypothetical protein
MLGAMALLAGCATGGSDRVVCPPVAPYPRDVQARAAAELAALPAGAVLPVLMDDYGALRAWIRGACPR